MANTALNDLVPFVKSLLGERFVKKDATILTGLRLVLNMGHVPGFSLTPAMDAVTPGLTAPREFTLLVGQAAMRLITPDSASTGRRLRAFSEQHGDGRHVVEELRQLVELARNNGSSRAMLSWQDFGGLCRGYQTMEDFYQKVMRANVAAPWGAASFTSGGTFVEMGGASADVGAGSAPVLVAS